MQGKNVSSESSRYSVVKEGTCFYELAHPQGNINLESGGPATEKNPQIENKYKISISSQCGRPTCVEKEQK